MTARLAVLVNPCGGTHKGIQVLNRVRPLLESGGFELDVRMTERSGHGSEIAHSLDLSDYSGIAVIGGDGTFHEVADGLMQKNGPFSTPLAIIPAGTGNTLAQHLGCLDPVLAAKRIVDGKTVPLDVIRVTLQDRIVFCTNIVGWGAVTDINITAEQLRLFGRSRYSLAALWRMLIPQHRQATLILDGVSCEDNFLFVIGCNAKYTGANMKLTPAAELGDGKIDVVIVRKASRWQMLNLFARVFDGSHVGLDFIEFHQVRSFSILTGRKDCLNLDGELKGVSPLTAEVLPGALQIFCPLA